MFSRASDLLFPSDSLDWVYIDGNHEYEHVIADLEVFYRKLKSGGILAGDDYDWGEARGCPVRRAVHEPVRPAEAVVLSGWTSTTA